MLVLTCECYNHTAAGGNKGIGKEIARRIGREPNFTVLIACRNLELGQVAIQDLKSCNNNDGDDKECNVILLPIPFDLTNPTSIKEAAEWVEDEYNGVLDILINNAATPTPFDKETIQHSKIKLILQSIQTTLVH